MATPVPKKSLGQHWLFDSHSLGAMCDMARLEPDDTVLEIGPGLGPLTVELVQRAKQVIAVELDDTLARQLPARVPAPNLVVKHQDILQFDLSQMPRGYKVVANVPYYLTSNLLRFLLESPTPPSLIVMLIQKEVAEHLAAKPGAMSVLAVTAQLHAHVMLGPVVTADKFDPPPKVDSQIVMLEHRTAPLFADLDHKQFFRMVKAGFGEKRKTLRNSLSGGLGLTKEQAETLLVEANISPDKRAQALTLDDWQRLAAALPH